MACEAYVDALADVAAGCSAPPEVRAHLETCRVCHAELRAQQQALALIDAELGELLASDPSPSLRARISLAVAEAGPARRTLAWPVAAAVAVSVVALALVVGLRDRHDRDGETRPSNDPPPLSSGPGRQTEGEVSPKATVKPSRVAGFPAQRREVEPSRLEPDVLVPPEEAELLVRFALELQQRQVSPGSLVASEGPAPPLRESPPLHIAPLDIASLDAPDASGT